MPYPRALREDAVAYYEHSAGRDPNAFYKDESEGLSEFDPGAPERLPKVLIGTGAERFKAMTGLSYGDVPSSKTVFGWLRDGIGPDGSRGKSFDKRSIRGFDLLTPAPKSVSLHLAFGPERSSSAVRQAHESASSASMGHLGRYGAFSHQRNAKTGSREFVPMGFFAGFAYLHESTRTGDPHVHHHVCVPNRVPKLDDDNKRVSYDYRIMLYEARAASMVYHAVLRAELTARLGVAWEDVSLASGVAEIQGFSREVIVAWSSRSTDLKQWAETYFNTPADQLSMRQMDISKRATRPARPESLSLVQMRELWSKDPRASLVDVASTLDRTGPSSSIRYPDEKDVRLALQATKPTYSRSDAFEVAASLWPSNDPNTKDIYANIRSLVNDVVGRSMSLNKATSNYRPGGRRMVSQDTPSSVLDLLRMSGGASFRVDNPSQIASRHISEVLSTPKSVVPLCVEPGALNGQFELFKEAASLQGVRMIGLRKLNEEEAQQVLERLSPENLKTKTLLVLMDSPSVEMSSFNKLLSALGGPNFKLAHVGVDSASKTSHVFRALMSRLPWLVDSRHRSFSKCKEEHKAFEDMASQDSATVAKGVSWFVQQGKCVYSSKESAAKWATDQVKRDAVDGLDSIIVSDSQPLVSRLNKSLQRQSSSRRKEPSRTAAALSGAQNAWAGDIIAVPAEGSNEKTRRVRRMLVTAVGDDKSARCAYVNDAGQVQEIQLAPDALGKADLGYVLHSSVEVVGDVDRAYTLRDSRRLTRSNVLSSLSTGTQGNHVLLHEPSVRSAKLSKHEASRKISNALTRGTTRRDPATLVAALPGEKVGRAAEAFKKDVESLYAEHVAAHRAWSTQRPVERDGGRQGPTLTDLQRQHLDRTVRNQRERGKEQGRDQGKGMGR
jgi:conjugative relaxase-like TrwC/TraI family protein